MKDKIQYCPKCGNLLKFKGSRIFWCRVCKKSVYYERIPEYKKDKHEKVEHNLFGKPKIKGFKIRVKSWSTSR